MIGGYPLPVLGVHRRAANGAVIAVPARAICRHHDGQQERPPVLFGGAGVPARALRTDASPDRARVRPGRESSAVVVFVR